LAKQKMAAATVEKAKWTFEQPLFPELGERPIRQITAPDLLAALRKLEARGKIDTAHRTHQRTSQIFRYAIATGRAEHDPAADRRGALTPLEVEYVPLSRQAVAILREIRPITGSGRLVFPSLRTNTRPISEGTLNAALRRVGFSKEEMTGHGFRTMASTLLNEQGWHPDLIELQLAHAERNKVRAAYNRAQRLDERRKMMQAYADYLDELKTGGNVVPIRKAG
jgi:integrase